MNKSIKFLGMALMSMVLVFTSCKKDKTEEDVQPTSDKFTTYTLSTQNNIVVDNWVYYSFETNSEVSGIDSSNFKTSDAWDIAFHSRHVRLNGGTSGSGMAEAYDAGVVDFSSITLANETGYIPDSFVVDVLYAGMNGSTPIFKSTDMSTVFENAFTVDQNTNPPTYAANNNVYVIKTRTGKYAKIMLKDYYNDLGESGYTTFKYQLATGDTRNFE
jgi:hypothetical protein